MSILKLAFVGFRCFGGDTFRWVPDRVPFDDDLNIVYDLSLHPHADLNHVLAFLRSEDPHREADEYDRNVQPDGVARVAALLDSLARPNATAFYGYDTENNLLEISPADDEGQVRELARRFRSLSGEYEIMIPDHSGKGDGVPGSCSRTIPYSDFPGIKFCTRTPGGMRVHLPRPPPKAVSEAADALSDLDRSVAKSMSDDSLPLRAKGSTKKKSGCAKQARPAQDQEDGKAAKSRPAREPSIRLNKANHVSVVIDEGTVSCCKCEFKASLGNVLTLSQPA